MSNTTLTDTAIHIVKRKKKPILFSKLWDELCVAMNFSEADKKNKMIKFYNALSLDSRFVQLEKNTWDLKERQTYEATRLKVEDIDYDDELLGIEEINDETFEVYESHHEEGY